MDGVPGELGEMSLVLDERARERLAEGRRLLGVIVSEHGRLRQAAAEEGWRLGSDRPALRAYEQWDPAEHSSSPGEATVGSVGLTMAESFLRHGRTGEAAGAVPGMVRALKHALSLAGA